MVGPRVPLAGVRCRKRLTSRRSAVQKQQRYDQAASEAQKVRAESRRPPPASSREPHVCVQTLDAGLSNDAELCNLLGAALLHLGELGGTETALKYARTRHESAARARL